MLEVEHSEPWETQDGWEQRVLQPIIEYPMAPREALAILEAAGQALQQGLSVEAIIAAMRSRSGLAGRRQ